MTDADASSQFIVRRMESSDVTQVQAIAARVDTAPHWPHSEFVRLANVVAARPEKRGAWVVLSGPDWVVGFGYIHRVLDEAEVESIVTAPEFSWARRGRDAADGNDRLEPRSRPVAPVAGVPPVERERFTAVPNARLSGRWSEASGTIRNPEEDAVLMSLPLL